MIQMSTILEVADNSGAKRVQCVKVLGGSRRRYARLGDVIIVSIKEAVAGAKVKKGDTAKAVVVRVKDDTGRVDGSSIRSTRTAPSSSTRSSSRSVPVSSDRSPASSAARSS